MDVQVETRIMMQACVINVTIRHSKPYLREMYKKVDVEVEDHEVAHGV